MLEWKASPAPFNSFQVDFGEVLLGVGGEVQVAAHLGPQSFNPSELN